MKIYEEHVRYNAELIADEVSYYGTRNDVQSKAYEILLETIGGEQIEFVKHLKSLKAMCTDHQMYLQIESLINMYEGNDNENV